jgi:hypothetical protein
MKDKLNTTGEKLHEEDPAIFRYRIPVPLEVCLGKTAGSQEFDEIMVGRFTRISFHRTLRIPEDGRDYPLPAGLGRFPIHRVEDYAEKVPAKWLQEGGFFIPLYQKEALFLQFDGPKWHPTIAKVCVGKINAISGKPYSEGLSRQQQDYVVIPNQKWLDGICSGEGLVKQFVAMPLGQGYTIEAQITDEERFGGFQIVIMDAVDGRFVDRDPAIDSRIKAEEEAKRRRKSGVLYAGPLPRASVVPLGSSASSMGIAAGGSIKQQIQKDTYGVESWSPEKRRSLTIHLVNSLAYKAITGMEPPTSPITAAAYQRAKIPWYSNYDETAPIVKPPSIFKRILSIAQIEKKRGVTPPDDEFQRSIAIQNIHKIKTPDKNEASNAFRERAYESRSKEWWEAAVREISYVIDLDVDVSADDFVLRSCCNYHLGQFRDGAIDGSLGLERNKGCVEALSWRAYCRKSLGDHEGLHEDATALMLIPKTEVLGLELKAEALFLAEQYHEAWGYAMELKAKVPGHLRADQIVSEANIKIFGFDIKDDHEF